MKQNASLTLMETLVMVLVFAIAAVICLQAFVRADRISQETAIKEEAAFLAQNGAETLKAFRGDLSAAADALGGTVNENTLLVLQDSICLEANISFSGVPGLGTAQIRILDTENGTVLYSLTAAWQEGS